ncbi:MAG TPA: sialidase family protein [Clostridia bacterium]|nr:sialidase family protein [Clostridia bacterium]HXK71529.1 sialidase family protein [Clostridia bacterium]
MPFELLEKQDKYLSYKDYFILGPTVAYCNNSDEMIMNFDLFNGSDSNTGSLILRSLDNGLTWQEQHMIEKSYVYDFKNSWVKSGYGALYTDEVANVMVYFANDTYWEENKLASLWRMRTLYYRISFDNGHTWTDKKYIIQKGMSYDKTHFIKEVEFEKNMAAMVSPLVVRSQDGTLLLSVQIQVLNDDGTLLNPTGMGFMKAGALKGTWNKDKLEYEWDINQYVTVGLDKSVRGLYEPTFGLLDNNKVIMIMRNSNYRQSDKIIGTKFYSVSNDNGYTWSEPKMLTFNDGSIMYSSSCIPKLLNHSNNKLYYIGVINEKNPEGNLPRYPLCIAEVDKKSCKVIKDTVMVIDTKRSNHETMEKTSNVVDYSNHGVYEDKLTGNLVVLAPYREDLTKYPCYLNRYVVKVG